MHKCKGISESCFIIKFCIFYPLVYILTIHTHNEYTYHCALRMPTGIESSVRQRGFGHLTFIIAILQIYIKKMKTLLERARDTTLSSSMLIIKIDSWDPSLFCMSHCILGVLACCIVTTVSALDQVPPLGLEHLPFNKWDYTGTLDNVVYKVRHAHFSPTLMYSRQPLWYSGTSSIPLTPYRRIDYSIGRKKALPPSLPKRLFVWKSKEQVVSCNLNAARLGQQRLHFCCAQHVGARRFGIPLPIPSTSSLDILFTRAYRCAFLPFSSSFFWGTDET